MVIIWYNNIKNLLKKDFIIGKSVTILGKGIDKKIHTIEAKKVDDVPYVDKITEFCMDESGKIVKTDL